MVLDARCYRCCVGTITSCRNLDEYKELKMTTNKIPTHPGTGEPYKVGDELTTFVEAAPLLDAWRLIEDSQRGDWRRNRSGVNESSIIVYPHEFPITLLHLPPQWEELKPKTLDLSEDSTLKEVWEAMKPFKKLLYVWPDGEKDQEAATHLSNKWAVRQYLWAWTCLRVGGTVKVVD